MKLYKFSHYAMTSGDADPDTTRCSRCDRPMRDWKFTCCLPASIPLRTWREIGAAAVDKFRDDLAKLARS